MELKRRLYLALAPEARRNGLSLTNAFIVGLVIISFLFLALETEPTLQAIPRWQQAFGIFNVAVIIIFAIEYAARVWCAGIDPQFRGLRGRLRYMGQFYSIADLLAFLPEFVLMLIGAGNSLLVLRVLRLARLVKIARFIPAFEALGAAVRRASSLLLTSLALAVTLVYVSAVLLYFVEGVGGGHQEAFASIPRSIWWAVATLTTVGYGDVYPVTPLGRFCAGIIAIAGIGVVALPAGVFASAFSDELRERELSRLKEELEQTRADAAAENRE
ncbi:ion transporter [Hyphomonas sp. WL0036]|uniref:ion transporter n=1 Tax=Hyphomonas sediminis TaxID=2866160 RepID=UPI001C7F1F4A|nr:ion transporter [Hyphomonas sediminis]MBY9065589.1 ion transporter [Hyphomonas sediminis]